MKGRADHGSPNPDSMPQRTPHPVPYVEVPGGGADRRLLVVSYHFPPGGAIGGLRWQRLSRLAAERGWGVDVVALDPREAPDADQARLQDLPPGLRAYPASAEPLPLDRFEEWLATIVRGLRSLRTPSSAGAATESGPRPNQPRSYARSEVHWHGNLASVEQAWHAWRAAQAERSWARAAARVGGAIAVMGVHRAVVSCGPPHHVHEAGRLIAARTRLPLVMDLRDPWSLQQRLTYGVASPLWFRIAERDERRVVAQSSLVVCNTEPAADAMRGRYPAARVITVMNGIDEGELPPSTVGSRFVLGYAGSIYLDRDPRPLFRAVARVVSERSLDPGRFGVEFIGYAARYEGQSLVDIAQDEGVAEYVRIGAPRPHGEAMKFLASCAMLVSLPQDSTMAIPSKVFEYLRFPAWLLAMAEPGSATARVLAGTGADVVPPADVGAIAAAIGRRFDAFEAGERPSPLGTDPRLTRRHQGGLLLDAIDDLTRQ